MDLPYETDWQRDEQWPQGCEHQPETDVVKLLKKKKTEKVCQTCKLKINRVAEKKRNLFKRTISTTMMENWAPITTGWFWKPIIITMLLSFSHVKRNSSLASTRPFKHYVLTKVRPGGKRKRERSIQKNRAQNHSISQVVWGVCNFPTLPNTRFPVPFSLPAPFSVLPPFSCTPSPLAFLINNTHSFTFPLH